MIKQNKEHRLCRDLMGEEVTCPFSPKEIFPGKQARQEGGCCPGPLACASTLPIGLGFPPLAFSKNQGSRGKHFFCYLRIHKTIQCVTLRFLGEECRAPGWNLLSVRCGGRSEVSLCPRTVGGLFKFDSLGQEFQPAQTIGTFKAFKLGDPTHLSFT